ncbi:inhibitor of growth protein 1 isoform X2 [Neocloeon triangulifer]|uniref:inhibitor of growth protein 1 isoform X2 n=1 Tax=Neocloeon triangulifer TaxID=2078957 RepID=UPI00286EECD0|nr:inhibitor of growth protein 1 isoform X2 [Neocloeon triangulifer]
MLNQAAAEALYSATYVENYLDCLENLPDDLQRQLSRLRELDALYQGYTDELGELTESFKKESDGAALRKLQTQMQQTLIRAQEIGDEKLQAVNILQELIENQARLLETDSKNLDFGKDQENTEPSSKEIPSGPREQTSYSSSSNVTTMAVVNSASNSERQSKRARRSRVEIVEETYTSITIQTSSTTERNVETRGNSSVSENSKSNSGGNSGGMSSSNVNQRKQTKKKKRKAKQEKEQKQQKRQHQQDDSPQEIPIDPDEPTYCLCDQISYGEMICCDNDLCPIEWFHFSCVSLSSKPKGKWFCPRCRGDRPNIMKPKAQFLKELERYNKEKEEKA